MKRFWITLTMALVLFVATRPGDVYSQIGYQVEGSTISGGPLTIDSGLNSAPAYSFTSDTDTGFYYTTNTINWAVSGVKRGAFSDIGVSVRDGTISLPSYSFTNGGTNGLYNTTAAAAGVVDLLGMAQGGNDLGAWGVATGTLTATQVRKLNATPVEVIAAPGAGFAVVVESVQWHLDYGGTVFDSVGAGEDLTLVWDAGNTRVTGDCDNGEGGIVGCLDADGTVDSFGHSQAYDFANNAQVLFAADGVMAQILVGEWASTDDDSDGNSPIRYIIRYRVVKVDLS